MHAKYNIANVSEITRLWSELYTF